MATFATLKIGDVFTLPGASNKRQRYVKLSSRRFVERDLRDAPPIDVVRDMGREGMAVSAAQERVNATELARLLRSADRGLAVAERLRKTGGGGGARGVSVSDSRTLVTDRLIEPMLKFNRDGVNKFGQARGNIPSAVHVLTALSRSLKAGNMEPLHPSVLAEYMRSRDVPEDEIADVMATILSGKVREVKRKAAANSEEREWWQKPASTVLDEMRAGHLSHVTIGDIIDSYKARGVTRDRAWGELMKDVHLLPRFRTEAPKNARDFLKLWDR